MDPQISRSPKDRLAEIDRCLNMIVPSASDESKFVGMLILPKLLEQDNLEQIEHVFNGMNFKFIERLLRTTHSVEAEVPDPVLKEIAVNILGCFAHYETLASNQLIVDRIPGLSRLLEARETEQTTEILNMLNCIAVKKEGLVKMLDPDVLKNILQVLLETKEKATRTQCTELLTAIYARSFQLIENEKIPSLTSSLKYSLATLLHILSATVNDDQDTLKFEAVNILTSVLMDVPQDMMKQVKAENEKKLNSWLSDLLNGLRQILTSKLHDTQRDKAILLVSCLLRYFGNEWLFKSLQDTKQCKRKKAKSDIHNLAYTKANFPALLIHLVSIEAKVMLDDINDRILRQHNENKKIINVTKQTRQELMIPVYFEILESSMEYLATHYSEDQESGMDPEMLLKIRTTLSDTMDVTMELLKFMQGIVERPQDLDDNHIAQACIRLVSIWMAEEGFEMPS